ncbi:MAG: monovalent cation/H(+) antiporter subunit G [Thermodesulfovibrionales bacterium]|nr:monovalent cation/H(+) antiporter subunit G [Thermodesulfovibrionales bacterium]
MEIRVIISGILIFSGCFLILVAAIGVVRFPDFYSRMHPGGKADSMGQLLALLGLMVYEGFSFVSVKLGLIIVFIYIANPTATYALAKAAHLKGVPYWRKDSDKKEDGNGD